MGGIYKVNALIGSYLVGDQFFLSHFDNPAPGRGSCFKDRWDPEPSKAAGEAGAGSRTPKCPCSDPCAIRANNSSSRVNQLLGIVYTLLGLAVVIALIGIVNTLMLSVFERTREIGLLRAVGMRRRQVRVDDPVRAVILAIFGALIGVVGGDGDGCALCPRCGGRGSPRSWCPCPAW